MTDEKAPKERDFVFLVRRLWQQPSGTALVFNCQMGRGRTSTGMIIASLLLLRQASNPLVLPVEPAGAPPPSPSVEKDCQCSLADTEVELPFPHSSNP